MEYNREDFDNNLSMGENGLLYYGDILKKDYMNKIIISTILKLKQKGYAEVNENEKNELIIEIKEGTKTLKKTETFVYEILKIIDIDEDNIVTLHEFKVSKLFGKNKKYIKELIIQEAMDDELIDIKNFKKKRAYFFVTLGLLIMIIFSILPSILYYYCFGIFVFLVCFIIKADYYKVIEKTNKKIRELKNKLTKQDIMKYSSKKENQYIILGLIVSIIVPIIRKI